MNKMINLDEYVGKAVHCRTKELANEFLKLAHEQGWHWIMGESLVEKNYWNKYKECICYYLNRDKDITCRNIIFYRFHDKQIIEFEGREKNVSTK